MSGKKQRNRKNQILPPKMTYEEKEAAIKAVREQLGRIFIEDGLKKDGIEHDEETGFTLEKITENHLHNLGIGDGYINISVELDGKVSRISKVPLSMLRELQVYHERFVVGETVMGHVETLITELNECK